VNLATGAGATVPVKESISMDYYLGPFRYGEDVLVFKSRIEALEFLKEVVSDSGVEDDECALKTASDIDDLILTHKKQNSRSLLKDDLPWLEIECDGEWCDFINTSTHLWYEWGSRYMEGTASVYRFMSDDQAETEDVICEEIDDMIMPGVPPEDPNDEDFKDIFSIIAPITPG